MRLPYLAIWDKTPVVVNVSGGGMDENGVTIPDVVYEGKCNFTAVAKTRMSKDGKMLNLGGVLTIRGDIAPSIPNITGTAVVEGSTRHILRSEKVRNPDGSVNHTRLELL